MATKLIVNVRYDMAQKTGIFCQVSPDILDRFLQSLRAEDRSEIFISISPSSNLGVYAVKTCNFCRHAPAFLGRSLYVTMAFRNGLEDRNFDFSRVIGKPFCTPYRHLVRFGSVTPECKI